ncbi:MAG: PorP/SprF family type IX secretion system membrane protein [Bacteroidaceae bacterium]|nr:PorP/SprF family type IX secretion system membrane protein [Bacteroidaceae bacterium]
MRMKRLLWIGLFLLTTLGVRAQYDVAFTNYWALQSFYNPAATGLDGLLNVQAAYSMQMAGFEDAPASMYVGADMPVFFLSPRHGMGVGFLNDDVGLFKNKKFFLQYAYHQPLFGGKFSIGARAGLLQNGFDGTDLNVEHSSDPAFASSDVNGTGFDLDVGFRYSYKQVWYVGVSAMHCLGPTISLGDDKIYEISIDPSLYLAGGYKLKFRQPQYALMTNACLRTDMQDWRADITARLAYDGEKHKLYGGVNYSPTKSVAVMLGIDFHGINLGYSYEMYTRGIGALNGTHELVLGYQTDLDLFKKGKNLHKSVRLL